MYLRSLAIHSFIRSRLIITMCLTLTGLSACGQGERIELLEQAQRRAQSDSATMRKDLDSIGSSLADTRADMKQLERQFSGLKERVEEIRHQLGQQIDQSTRQGDQRVKDLEATAAKFTDRIKAYEEQLKLNEEELRELRKGMQLAENESVRRDYEMAWRDLGQKDYRSAVTRFRDFVKKYPRSKLADSAQYYVGESHYALRELEQAIVEFDAVRSRYPQGEKVSAALLKQGFAFAELGENANAKLVLQQVVDNYAQTPEADQAREKLKSLES
jgi:tol-pal system protein YbgF